MRILRCLNTGLYLLPGGLFSRGKAGFLPAGTAAEPSLALCRRAGRLMFLLAGRYHNIYLVVFYLVAVIVGEAARLLMLPKDIKAHLKDTGYRER